MSSPKAEASSNRPNSSVEDSLEGATLGDSEEGINGMIDNPHAANLVLVKSDIPDKTVDLVPGLDQGRVILSNIPSGPPIVSSDSAPHDRSRPSNIPSDPPRVSSGFPSVPFGSAPIVRLELSEELLGVRHVFLCLSHLLIGRRLDVVRNLP